MQNSFNIQQEVNKLWKNRKLILGFTIGIGLLVGVYTLFLEDEYSSNAIFIPPNISDVKSMTYTKSRPLSVGAGGDVDIERTITILKADNIAAKIANKFNLLMHYGIDTTDSKAAAKQLINKMSENIILSTLKYTAIQVIVFDKDPKMSADIANEYLFLADSVIEGIAKRKDNLANLKIHIEKIKEERQQLIDTLAYYRKKHRLYHLDDMSGNVANALAQSMQSDPAFAENYDKVYGFEIRLNRLDDLYNLMLEEKELRERHLRSIPSLIDVVNYAEPAKIKARPHRLLIVLSSMFLGFIVVCLYVIFKEQEQVYVI